MARPGAPNGLSPLSMDTDALEPYVLKTLEKHSGFSLRTPDVLRVVDSMLLEAGETLYTGSQQVRVVLRRLVQNPHVKVFARPTDGRDDAEAMREGQVVWVFSDTDPVPAWSREHVAETVMTLAPTRRHPEHRLTGRRPKPETTKAETPTPDTVTRAELIVSLVRELARDADQAGDLEAANREIRKLTGLNEKLRSERDSAVKQLKAITRVITGANPS